MRVVVVGLLLVCTGLVYADSHDVEQHQSQGQGQDQAQGQVQGQIAVGVGGSAAQSSDQANSQDVHVQTETHEKSLYKGAMYQNVPEGNEGPLITSPWGGAAITRQAETTRIVAAYNLLPAGDERRATLVTQAVEAAKPCRWLGVGPQRFGILGGLDCWTALRK